VNLQALPEEALKEILALTEAKTRMDLRDQAQNLFMPFAHHVYDNFIEGRHHRIIAEKLEQVARGELKRLIINMPPRHSKSEFASFLMPAWFLGRNPKLKIIQATHNTELAVRFGRKVRDLIDDPKYKEVFPKTHLKEDNKGAGKWGTSLGGEYFAAGVGAAVTGRGADLFIIDDPHSEQDALSETAFDHAYEWYTSGPRQRLQPGGAIIVVMTRWGKKDLTGRLLAAQGSDIMSDKWDVVEFPAIMPSGNALWPEFWKRTHCFRSRLRFLLANGPRNGSNSLLLVTLLLLDGSGGSLGKKKRSLLCRISYKLMIQHTQRRKQPTILLLLLGACLSL
jgi:hypothetical protein